VTFLLGVSAAVPAFAYDASWYKANGWSGEYPYGFTMAKDVTVKIRENLDPNAPKTISCDLKKGATYHAWNSKRFKSDQLEFISFTKIETYELKSSFRANVTRGSDGRKATINFKKGNRWFFLVYLAEGYFQFRFNNTVYEGDQELLAKSTQISSTKDDQRTYEEWLKLKCANGTVGWIFVEEVRDAPDFSEPNITEYGKASDQSESVRRSAGIPSTENKFVPLAPSVPNVDSFSTIAPSGNIAVGDIAIIASAGEWRVLKTRSAIDGQVSCSISSNQYAKHSIAFGHVVPELGHVVFGGDEDHALQINLIREWSGEKATHFTDKYTPTQVVIGFDENTKTYDGRDYEFTNSVVIVLDKKEASTFMSMFIRAQTIHVKAAYNKNKWSISKEGIGPVMDAYYKCMKPFIK